MVRDGDTVMLAGLIRQFDSAGASGVPGLARLPVIGGLFGRQSDESSRREILVLITPRVVRTTQDTRALTDDYLRRFESLEPLRVPPVG